MAEVEHPRVVRRKFATPPVKLACLSCRASRTRCDGGQPCASCVTKSHECVYRPSRRGGPRVRKKNAANAGARPVPDIRPSEAETVMPQVPQPPIAVTHFIDPGAALGQLPDLTQDSDFIFDSLFPASFPDTVFDGVSLPQGIIAVPEKSGPLVRTYRSEHALLQAYYCWVHPYIPILPPPDTSPPLDEPFPLSQNEPNISDDVYEPTTPIALALSAVLALVPCAEDTDPTAPDAVLFRRKFAQFFAQSAIECIEAEAEITESSTEPSKALESSPPPADRAPFHPRSPVELESIIALNLLSVYEYAQRGNIKKMTRRAGQALMDAMMNFNLHAQPEDDDDDFFAEAKRRVWWMTYINATQTSIVGCAPPPLQLYGSTFTTKFPTLAADPKAWPDYIDTQQAILAATQFTLELKSVLASKADLGPMNQKMIELEKRIGPLVEKSEAWEVTGPLAPVVDANEEVLVRSLRSMARIKINSARVKLHRCNAFFDQPIFNVKVCDLAPLQNTASDSDPMAWVMMCSCSPLSYNSTKSDSPESTHMSSLGSPSTASTTPMLSSARAHDPSTTASLCNANFTSHQSAKICLRSAISIANAYDNMPYPNPNGQFGQDVCFLSPTSPIVAPRMLPSYACCAMQSAYVFLSIFRKTKAIPTGAVSKTYLASMLMQLQRGITSILAVLENYGSAFEALKSMQDQVRISAEPLIALDLTAA